MTNLLFLFDDCKKFIVRIGEDGFIEECKKHSAAPCRIIALNGLNEDPQVGAIILMERAQRLHVVQPFESLQSVCEYYGAKEDELLEYNAISYIYPYQIVEIP